MVGSGGRVKVLDFGLAKVESSAGAASDSTALPTEMKTQEGVVMGTVPYMSPEQVQGRPLDLRTDIFSLGIILFEMATGQRPFHGESSAELVSSILRDTPPSVVELRADLPSELGRVIGRCLEKSVAERFPSAQELRYGLRGVPTGATPVRSATTPVSRPPAPVDSGAARADEGFWVAVLPFKYGGPDASLAALADGLTEEIVTGLSRFSYLKVISRRAAADAQAAGRDLGARYVLEGSLRHAGSRIRLAVQLVDANSGAHLWAETYERAFDPEAAFQLQDDLVPRIVSTIADAHGILPHTMSEAIRDKSPEQLSPYEAVLRSFRYAERLTPEEHAQARAGLERAVQLAPGYAYAWAMLAFLVNDEYAMGFNPRPDPLGRALEAARRAVELDSSGHRGYQALAVTLFYRREIQAFRAAAERALALNPMDGCNIAHLGSFLAYAGEWERGCALVEQASQLNPNHPGWFWFPLFFNAYRKHDYRGALSFALKINLPGLHSTHIVLAAAYGQLGQRDEAGNAVRELLKLMPEVALLARPGLEMLLEPELVEDMIDGLRKAGLEGPPPS